MKRALIFGRAKGIWEEVKAAQAMASFDFTIGVGPSVVDYPGEVDHWVWFHTELFQNICERRAHNGYPPIKNYWSVKHGGRTRIGTANGIPINYIDWKGGGASGLIAIIIALDHLGCERVALCGIPMTPEGGQYDSVKTWKEAEKHQHAWITNKDKLIGRVRSFTGWTLELLEGQPPTAEWLAGEQGKASGEPPLPSTQPTSVRRVRRAVNAAA